MSLQIIYQDEYLIALNKPHGLLSVPGKGADKQDCLATRVQNEISEAKVVHRLDCHTSGVMIMGLGKEAQRSLSKLFHDRRVRKQYIAVVSGRINEPEGEIDVPMRGDPEQRPTQVIDYEMGKQAITKWRMLNIEEENTRLMLFPVTGRTHQLRVHCKYMGHPIVGDKLYGELQKNRQSINSSRMLLHAALIELTHPQSGELIKLESPCEF